MSGFVPLLRYSHAVLPSALQGVGLNRKSTILGNFAVTISRLVSTKYDCGTLSRMTLDELTIHHRLAHTN